MMKPVPAHIVQAENQEAVPAKIIAQSIVKIADAAKAMYSSGLNEKAIVLLLSTASGVCKRDVQCVIAAMYHLKSTYLVQPKAK
jgi:hypothetical protein